MKKTTFILPMFLSNMIAGVISGAMIYFSDGNLIWLGALMATIPLPFFLLVLSNALKLTSTSEKLPVIQLLNLAGFAYVAYSLYSYEGSPGLIQFIPLAIATLGLISVQWYVRIFSYYNREKSKAIIKGRKLPEMRFKALDKTDVSSVSFDGQKTLLVFFRANWCPFCMNQLNEVKKHAEKLLKLGVKVKFISNQGFKNSKDLEMKLDLPMNFEILQDEDLKGAKVLGIEDIDGSPVGMPGYPKDTVMATVVALDEDGKVLFGDETDNYRRRPNPNSFLHVFE